MDDHDQPDERKLKPRGFSRLQFLKGTGAAVAGVGIVGLAGCDSQTGVATAPVNELAEPDEMKDKYPATEAPPNSIPEQEMLHVFSPEEAAAVEAFAARIIPGTPDDPGAREAGVVNYIDNMLAYHGGAVQPTYTKPPFAKAYTGAKPSSDTVNGYKVVWVEKKELPRYGTQTKLTPIESYRTGLQALDKYSRKKFHKPFAHLSEHQQDAIVTDLAAGKSAGFTEPTSQAFFAMLRTHTIEGMFSDPLYGGNRNMVGWKMVGYPGAQRAYTPHDIHNEKFYRAPQSLADMMAFVPGENVGSNVILPVSGSTERGNQQTGSKISANPKGQNGR